MNNNKVKIDEKKFEPSKIIASGLLFDNKGKVLIITLKDTNNNLIKIAPGGRVKSGETLRDCLIREFKEEVGINIKIEKLFGILEKEYEDGIWTIIYFKVNKVSGRINNNEPDEIKEVSFVELSQLDNYSNISWINSK